jgi:hypothetical protein
LLVTFINHFLLLREAKGIVVLYLFILQGEGVRLDFFLTKCFFHCGEPREGKGVIFKKNSLWDGGKGASGERVQVDFFLLFFIVEGEGGGG